jgi:excisionase family DNA binding protein
MSEVVNAVELAKRLRVTPNTVHVWNRRGLIPSLRVGKRTVRFDVSKVLEALSMGNQTAPQIVK